MRGWVYKFYDKESKRRISCIVHHEIGPLIGRIRTLDRRAISEYVEYKTKMFARALYPLGIKVHSLCFSQGGDQQ